MRRTYPWTNVTLINVKKLEGNGPTGRERVLNPYKNDTKVMYGKGVEEKKKTYGYCVCKKVNDYRVFWTSENLRKNKK